MPVIPQIITEDRASGAQFIDGSLRFNSGNSTYLNRTFGTPTNNIKWTWSGWVKRTNIGTIQSFFIGDDGSSNNFCSVRFLSTGEIDCAQISGGTYNLQVKTNAVFRDANAWYHIVLVYDSANATSTDRIQIYVNGNRQDVTYTTGPVSPSTASQINVNARAHAIGRILYVNLQYLDAYLSQVYFIDGQAFDASYFGFTDPLTNTWRPKKYTGTFTGTNSFYLPMDGNSPIGEDKSGRGNNWTPVNFGGSNSIEKATGALPILNTVNGGRVATVGVRTDAYASNLVLALPLVGSTADVSNQINSGSTAKTFTANGNAAASTLQSNFYGGSFYFDGTGDYLSSSTSNDFAIGTGDFTLEAWFNVASSQVGNARLFAQDTNSVTSWDCYIDGTSVTNNIMLHGGNIDLGMSFGTANTWHHFCIVRSSGTLYSFMDGALKNTQSYTYSFGNNTDEFRIGEIGSNYGSLGFGLNGYVQDFRIYKGVAKYISNFIPASTDPDILPDTPSGVAGGSALTKITDGAVSFDGTGDYLDVPESSGEFDFGTGDFTVEFFANANSYGTYNDIIGTANNASYLGASKSGWIIRYATSTGEWYFSYQSNNSWTFQATFSTNTATKRWHHVAFTRSGTDLKCFMDGVQQGSTVTNSTDLISTENSLRIGGGAGSTSALFNGFLSNVRIIKGTALYTSNFTPPSAPLTNVTNTTLLCCQSTTSATAAAVTPGSITANGNAAATNFNPFTTDINAVRGQESAYCILNSAATFNGDGGDIQDGGLKFECPASGDASTRGTIPIPASFKFYMEARYTVAAGGAGQARLGIAQVQQGYTKSGTGMWSIDFRGSAGTIQKDDQGSLTTLTGNPSDGDTVGIKIDLATGEFRAHRNGVYYDNGNALMTGIPNVESYFFAALDGGINRNDWEEVNFGQKPWKYPPGDGYQPLCSANLPKPTSPAAVRPDKYFNTVLYNGTGVTNNVTGVGFQPDFVWIKKRNAAEQHELQDSVRGATKRLASNLLASETTVAGSINSFDSDGFTVVDAGSTNENTYTYVGWSWKAGGNSGTFNIDGRGYATAAEAGLTAGTKASLLTGASVNTESGFSILTWTGDGAESNLFIPHGLPSLPKMVVIKKRNEAVDHWYVAHDGIQGTNYAYRMFWGPTKGGDLPDGTQATTDPYYLGTQSTNDTLLLGNTATYGGGNENNIQYVAYCWSEVPGFSKMGTYTGNGAVNGPLIECGFKPAWVMVKVAGGSTGNSWTVWDNKRDPVNEMNLYLHPNEAQQDGTYSAIKMDFYSNGFKPRGDVVHQNSSGVKYIYAAFAEAPTVNLYGGQANAR